MFRAAIFDMDGLLIDSEPYWQASEREVFGSVGIDITDEMAAITAPMTPRQVTEHWYGVRPWSGRSIEEVENAVIARVADHVRTRGAALPGVFDALALCARQGWRVALASNSPAMLCHLVLEVLGIAPAFHAVVSAEEVERGKPDPAIYQLAARKIGAAPEDCLVFEDSPTGVRAARAAGMRVIAIPSPGMRFADVEPDLTLRTLHEFEAAHAASLFRQAAGGRAGRVS
ncbi:MAG: hexitol phosphatase HxpB [Steroidobacteraceae bacterium]|nr:hexitol phosphatase HxpB [Steroidobacteraceae bacterium]